MYEHTSLSFLDCLERYCVVQFIQEKTFPKLQHIARQCVENILETESLRFDCARARSPCYDVRSSGTYVKVRRARCAERCGVRGTRACDVFISEPCINNVPGSATNLGEISPVVGNGFSKGTAY